MTLDTGPSREIVTLCVKKAVCRITAHVRINLWAGKFHVAVKGF